MGHWKNVTVWRSLVVAMFNKHLCQVCRPALDYVRGMPLSNSEIRQTGDKYRSVLEWQQNAHTLQQSVEEACYICRIIRDELLADRLLDARSVANVRIRMCTFSNIQSLGTFSSFTWQLVETEVSLDNLVHTVD